jgi:hypothetical protein
MRNVTITRAQILQALENGSVTVVIADVGNVPVFGQTITPTVIDIRPKGWSLNSGYEFPSRSRNRIVGHQVTIGSGEYACDCEAGRFGRECWAVAATKRALSTALYYPQSITSFGNPTGYRYATPSGNFGNRKATS